MKPIRSSMMVGTAAVALLALVGLGGSVTATTTHVVTKGTLGPAIHLTRHASVSPQSIPIDYSGNWSGYVALPLAGKTSAFDYVHASYTVPSVNCSVTNYAFSYHWVGLDGWTDGTVEQDGIGSFCVSGSPVYFAWYEMYPAGNIEEFAVDPGDAISSSVTYDGSSDYTLALTDQTTGQSFDLTEACSSTCANSSAEVITEGYTSSPYNGTADFGEQHYDTATVENSASKLGGLSSTHWSTIESVALGGTTGDVDTEPGPLFKATNESAFALTWYQEN